MFQGLPLSPSTNEEPSQDSKFSLDSVRALLNRMRASQTSNYYDSSLLQNPSEIPNRNVAPNEYNHINNGPAIPEDPLTLGSFLGENPVNNGLNSPPQQQQGGGYIPNVPGVAQSWSGGASVSDIFPETFARGWDMALNSDPLQENSSPETGNQDNNAVRPDQIKPDWGQVLNTNYTITDREPETHRLKCDTIGPGTCAPPPGYEFTETRTQEEIEKDLWHPGDIAR